MSAAAPWRNFYGQSLDELKPDDDPDTTARVPGPLRHDGLTEPEGAVMDALCQASDAYGRLPAQHPDERREFCEQINRCQDLLAIRIARRHYPQGWPTREPDATPSAKPDA